MTRRTRFAVLLFAAVASFAVFASGVQTVSPWEPAIVAFEAQDAEGVEAGGVVFVGSSTVRLWKLDQSFPELTAANRGFGGSQLSDAIAFFDRIIAPRKPAIVVLYAGDNDLAHYGKTVDQVVRDFATFDRQMQQSLPDSRLVFLSIKPSPARWDHQAAMTEANAAIQARCEADPRLIYVDLATPMLTADGTPNPALYAADGVHLSLAGYALWTEILAPVLSP